jgi:hypothetical protein|tara:strand:+ start:380 stop:556 length:177 start_codon:yes stop_codon:yes gene_type:complete
MALINSDKGIPATDKKFVVAPKIQPEPAKAVIEDVAPKAESYTPQPRATKMVNSKKTK